MNFDVNNLKMANDTLGHATGNKLILATAEELTKLYPENSYRVGGDEFIVLLQGKGSYLEIDKKIKEDIAKFNIAMKKRTADSKAKSDLCGFCGICDWRWQENQRRYPGRSR